MSIYSEFCTEIIDDTGKLLDFRLHYPDNFNFAYDVVDTVAERSPEKRALVWCNIENEERIFTFGDLRSFSNQAARVFRRGGIGRGDRVMLVLKRHYEYWIAALALHKLGAVMIPATHMLTPHDFAYRFQAARPKAIVCTCQNDVPAKIQQALTAAGLPFAPKLWCVKGYADGFANLDDAMTAEEPVFERLPTLATDPMALYFTSGTTGLPKGVIHDFRYPLAHIVTARYWQQAEEDGLHFTIAETGWAKASWGKMYGQWLVGSAVMVFDFDNFDPRQLTDVINRYGVTSFCAPPTVYRYLVRKGIPDMPTLRHASTAGEMLAPEVFRRFTERTGVPLCEGYGQTETTLLMANFSWDSPVAGTLGTVSPFYRIELRARNNEPVPCGEIGEIVILPPAGGQAGIFTAYLDAPEQYAQVWRNGVYHTGDAAWQDESGHYHFHGRFDDIIKTGGFRVGPGEVENVLMEHPSVVECSVIGVPDTLRGQAIKAIVVTAPDYPPSPALEQELRTFSNARLAEYKWVRLFEFTKEMPKTISGKIRKNEQRLAPQ